MLRKSDEAVRREHRKAQPAIVVIDEIPRAFRIPPVRRGSLPYRLAHALRILQDVFDHDDGDFPHVCARRREVSIQSKQLVENEGLHVYGTPSAKDQTSAGPAMLSAKHRISIASRYIFDR